MTFAKLAVVCTTAVAIIAICVPRTHGSVLNRSAGPATVTMMIDMRGFPDPGGLCRGASFYRNTTDCTQFYRCVDFNYNGKYTVFRFKCGSSTVFDERMSLCVWPSDVNPPCITNFPPGPITQRPTSPSPTPITSSTSNPSTVTPGPLPSTTPNTPSTSNRPTDTPEPRPSTTPNTPSTSNRPTKTPKPDPSTTQSTPSTSNRPTKTPKPDPSTTQSTPSTSNRPTKTPKPHPTQHTHPYHPDHPDHPDHPSTPGQTTTNKPKPTEGPGFGPNGRPGQSRPTDFF